VLLNTGLGIRTFWKCAIALFSTFSHIFAHSLISKERLCNCSFCRTFEKSNKKVRLHNCTFEKSDRKMLSHNLTFEKSDKKWSHNRTFVKSENVQCVNGRMCDCPTLLKHGLTRSGFVNFFYFYLETQKRFAPKQTARALRIERIRLRDSGQTRAQSYCELLEYYLIAWKIP